MDLSAEESRVLGCLVEKAMVTPEGYPLTLNSLVTACNQSTSRDPVVCYDADTVIEALDHLRARHRYVRVERPTRGSRVEKYKHVLHERLDLTDPELAIVAVLLLRGPQTVNELAARTERLHRFASPAEVEATLDGLSDPTKEIDAAHLRTRSDAGLLASSRAGDDDVERPADYRRPWSAPLITRLPRLPGQKEPRVAETLSGPVDVGALAARATTTGVSPSPRSSGNERTEAAERRIDALEAEVAQLHELLRSLRLELVEFRSQF